MNDVSSFDDPQVRSAAFAVLVCDSTSDQDRAIIARLPDEPFIRARTVLEEERMLDTDGEPTPQLIARLAGHWSPLIGPKPVARMPGPGDSEILELGLDSIGAGPGWALTGSIALRMWGAPISSRPSARHFYVPTHQVLDKAVSRLGLVDANHAQVILWHTPLHWIVNHRFDRSSSSEASHLSEWPVVHPTVAVLDHLASGGSQDELAGWSPGSGFKLVW